MLPCPFDVCDFNTSAKRTNTMFDKMKISLSLAVILTAGSAALASDACRHSSAMQPDRQVGVSLYAQM
jgi:hypothetical protein